MEKIKAHLLGKTVSSTSHSAFAMRQRGGFGEKSDDKIIYSFTEALFLSETGKMDIFISNEKLSTKELMRKLQKLDKKIQIKYSVFRDLRKKGYIVKSALKFGADFRVYEKGKSVAQEHSKWIVFASHESDKLTWHDFSAKNRIAHSVRKKLLLGIVDEENDVTYYEVAWVKP